MVTVSGMMRTSGSTPASVSSVSNCIVPVKVLLGTPGASYIITIVNSKMPNAPLAASTAIVRLDHERMIASLLASAFV